MPENDLGFILAREDFRRARQQASLQEVLSRFRGKSQDLLSYEEVLRRLHTGGSGIRRGLREIPLDSIVGSTGRYTDFTRSFLPRNPSDEERWARVMVMVTDPGGGGLAPIEVVQVGDVYFVKDGHHRVSVARQLGAKTIHAYVTEVPTKIPLTPDVEPQDLIRKEEYAGFLQQTDLGRTRPDANLEVTTLGQYADLLDHIQVHRYFMGLEAHSEMPLAKAAAHWYDQVYLPVIEIIREQGVLEDFPGRTETDLYLWVSEHRAELQQGFGDFISLESAASHFAEQQGTRAGRVAARIGKSLVGAVVPESLESGPPPGAWREEVESRESDRLFEVILVPISGEATGWTALDQAIPIARREGSRIHGLHILRDEAKEDSGTVKELRGEFARRCEQARLSGGLAVESGDVARRICERALLADLVILDLSHPPSPQLIHRLGSGFHTLIRKCARPILAVPGDPSGFARGLLAYDGSPKAREALYMAAYLASRWSIPLSVVAVEGSGTDAEDMLEEAGEYLHTRGVNPRRLLRSGPVAETILQTATETQSDFLIMGGYGSNPVVEVVLGSQVDAVLRESRLPILVCR
jgi:nucleotide-binding universal stress UspA family protein